MAKTFQIIIGDHTIELDRDSRNLYNMMTSESFEKNIVRESDGLPLSMIYDASSGRFILVNSSRDTIEILVSKKDDDISYSARKVDHLSPEVTSRMCRQQDYNRLHFDKKVTLDRLYGWSMCKYRIYIPISRLGDDNETLIAEMREWRVDRWLSPRAILKAAREEV